MDAIERKLRDLGYRFQEPVPPRPFDRVKIVGDLAFLSGHGPTDEGGKLVAVGRVGSDVSVEEGYEAARRVAVNCLGTLKTALGDLGRIEEVVKVLAFVNSAPEFHRQPEVVNGFTDLLVEVLGEKGRHARSAVGTSNLPGNQSVEVEMIVRVRAA
jgi:enamine deaminase RidA (YjgF/YER057c/UK114 family)